MEEKSQKCCYLLPNEDYHFQRRMIEEKFSTSAAYLRRLVLTDIENNPPKKVK